QAIGERAADQRKEEHRSGGEEAVDAEEERGVGHRKDDPALGHRLHPGAGGRGERAEPEEAEVAITKGAERAGERALRRLELGLQRLFLRQRRAHAPALTFSRTLRPAVWAWQMATASASAASAPSRS